MDGVGDLDSVFAGAFGFEECGVGFPHEIFGGVMGLELAQAYTDRGIDPLIVERDGIFGDHFQESLGDNEGIGERGVGEDDGELIAAVACRDIRFANAVNDMPCHVEEDGVTGAVSVLVVDLFEVIQVDHN